MMRSLIVAAAVFIREGRVLVTQRKAGTHLAGTWEFPGGKVEAGEDPRDALARELHEELGVVASVGDIVDVTFHAYPEDHKSVLLLFFRVALAANSPEPRPIDVADLRWAGRDELQDEQFPPADVPILNKVRGLLGGL